MMGLLSRLVTKGIVNAGKLAKENPEELIRGDILLDKGFQLGEKLYKIFF